MPRQFRSDDTSKWLEGFGNGSSGDLSLSATQEYKVANGSQNGVHTMKVQINWAGGEAPELTTNKKAWDDIGFIVHSATQISGVVIAQDM